MYEKYVTACFTILFNKWCYSQCFIHSFIHSFIQEFIRRPFKKSTQRRPSPATAIQISLKQPAKRTFIKVRFAICFWLCPCFMSRGIARNKFGGFGFQWGFLQSFFYSFRFFNSKKFIRAWVWNWLNRLYQRKVRSVLSNPFDTVGSRRSYFCSRWPHQ